MSVKDILRIEHVTKRFGSNVALNDVTFSIHANEYLSLLGPSGSGKTTLLRLIAGFEAPDAGQILFDNRSLAGVPAHRRDIGFVFQNFALFPHLDVRGNLDYGRRMNRLAEDGVLWRRVTELLDIGDLLDRRPGKLSGGERQRVALGRALLSQPRLLLLDEPLGSLDEERKEEILPYLVRLRDEAGIPMVYVSHDPSEMRQLASQIAIIRRGRVTAFGGVEVLPATLAQV